MTPVLALLLAFGTARAADDSLLAVMRAELDRQFAALSAREEYPVYYLAYQIVEVDNPELEASWGGVTWNDGGRRRHLDIDLRVGSSELDNTHRRYDHGGPGALVALDGAPDSIRADLWLETEREYRKAVERYIQAVAKRAVQVDEEDVSPDFSSGPPVRHVESGNQAELDRETWVERARRVSSVFRGTPEVLESAVRVSGRVDTSWFVNSEGAQIRQVEPAMGVSLEASARAEDGMNFTLFRLFPSRSPGGLPAEAKLSEAAAEMAATLAGLTVASEVDPFVGPALLSGKAAAVLFHEVLGHRLEGHRQKDENAGQTFTKKMNARILPEFISVVSDPTLSRLGGVALRGTYRFDDEGIASRRVVLVDHGILRSFLLSRSPVKGFPESNGHGRKQPGRGAVARQANLVVEASRTRPVDRLRAELVNLCRKRGQPYGLLFEEIKGGFTFTGRTAPNAFNVMPVIVRKVYVDGRPDELVRGVDLIGTPLTMLERIVLAGDDLGVFNGMCGAESGSVPVAAASPSLLIEEVEVQRKHKDQERPPLLRAPPWEAP